MSNSAFVQGYICALSCIAMGHGEGIALEEALAALGPVDWRTIEPYDKDALKKTRQRLRRKKPKP